MVTGERLGELINGVRGDLLFATNETKSAGVGEFISRELRFSKPEVRQSFREYLSANPEAWSDALKEAKSSLAKGEDSYRIPEGITNNIPDEVAKSAKEMSTDDKG